MKTYIATRIVQQPFVLVDDGTRRFALSPAGSENGDNRRPGGFDWGGVGPGPACLALSILLDLTGDQQLAHSLHQAFEWRFVAGAPKEGFRLTEQEIRDWISSTRPSPYEDQEDLIQSISRMIDKASLRQCYERKDPAIQHLAVVAPEHSLAEVTSHLVERSPEPRYLHQLVAEGKVVSILPDVRVLIKALANPAGLSPEDRALKAYLEARIDMEVEAFYCPPIYFVRFTGRRWE